MMPGGMNPRDMEKMMRQMGIKQEPIQATRVLMESENGTYVIENPEVVKVTMQGTVSFQITGEVRFDEKTSNDDIKMVAEQAGVSEEDAAKALEETNGDMAEAILKLKENKE